MNMTSPRKNAATKGRKGKGKVASPYGPAAKLPKLPKGPQLSGDLGSPDPLFWAGLSGKARLQEKRREAENLNAALTDVRKAYRADTTALKHNLGIYRRATADRGVTIENLKEQFGQVYARGVQDAWNGETEIRPVAMRPRRIEHYPARVAIDGYRDDAKFLESDPFGRDDGAVLAAVETDLIGPTVRYPTDGRKGSGRVDRDMIGSLLDTAVQKEHRDYVRTKKAVVPFFDGRYVPGGMPGKLAGFNLMMEIADSPGRGRALPIGTDHRDPDVDKSVGFHRRLAVHPAPPGTNTPIPILFTRHPEGEVPWEVLGFRPRKSSTAIGGGSA